MEQKKIMITGASSKTAEAMIDYFKTETYYELVLLSSLDLSKALSTNIKYYNIVSTDKQGVKKIALSERPNVIINCAAMTDVDNCEVEKMLSFELNAHVPEALARTAKIIDAHFITFSTDFIFDGKNGPYTELDLPNPISQYGKSKFAGENMSLSMWDKTTIVRTNVVFGKSSYNKNDFIKWVIGKIEDYIDFEVITGQWCNPTYTYDIARAVHKIISKERFGIYNVAGLDWLNRFEVAQLICDVYGGSIEKIHPIAPELLIQKAKRPEKGGLITLKAETDLGLRFLKLRSALEALKFKLII